MGNPGNQRDNEPVHYRVELLSNPRMFAEYGRQKGWEREIPATDTDNPPENLWTVCGGHGADGASILKMTARCRLRCYPVAEPVAGEKPITAGFSPL